MHESKIIAIIPAPGWRAAFRGGDGKIFYSPVAAWALNREGEVVGLDACEWVDSCEKFPDFIRYWGPGEKVPTDTDESGNEDKTNANNIDNK